MKQQQRFAAMAAVVFLCLSGCGGGDTEKQTSETDAGTAVSETTKPSENTTEQQQSAQPEEPSIDEGQSAGTETPQFEEPSAGDTPQSEGEDPVVVYVPDEQAENLTPVGTSAEDDSDQALIDALINAGAVPEGVEVLSSSEEDGILTLDLNAAFGEAVRSSGSTGETMLIYSVVNTFVQARGVDKVLITVEGGTLQSGHEIYDYPLSSKAEVE